MKPTFTRLRHIKSKDLSLIEEFFRQFTFRVHVWQINYAGGKWYVHFSPPADIRIDIPSKDLDA